MADETGISWCDATFNPWIGCEKVSPACAHCYAETLAEGRMGLSVWGKDAPRKVTADSTWKKPPRWARLAREGLLPDRSENRDGHRPRIFCASMADVFEERPDLEEPRRRLFALIHATPELDWLILTKRPDFARDWLFLAEPYMEGPLITRDDPDPLPWGLPPNVWLGVSIENSRFTWRADILRDIPAAVRFVSAEPLLGSLYPFRSWNEPMPSDGNLRANLNLTGIDWLIVGGESGGRASRPMHPDWARELRDDAVSRGIALHFKQWGSWGPAESGVYPGDLFWTVTPGAAWDERYVVGDDHVCAPNESEAEHLRYHGASPKASGKTLDGVEYCEFPGVLAA